MAFLLHKAQNFWLLLRGLKTFCCQQLRCSGTQNSLEPSPEPRMFLSGGTDIQRITANLAPTLPYWWTLDLVNLFLPPLELMPLFRSGMRFDRDHRLGTGLHSLGWGRLLFTLWKLELDGASTAAGFGSTSFIRRSLALSLVIFRIFLVLAGNSISKDTTQLRAGEDASRGRLRIRGLCKIIACL